MRKAPLDFSRYAMAAAAVGSVAAASTVNADFSAPYSLNPPANGTYNNQANNATFGAWKVVEPTSIANTVNTGSAPSSLTFSINNTSFAPRTLDLIATAASSGLVSFSWSAGLTATGFFGASSAAFVLNGVATTLANQPANGSSTPSGIFSMLVTAGDTFGFRVAQTYIGTAALTISNFSAPGAPTAGVPESSVEGMLALTATALIILRETRRRARA